MRLVGVRRIIRRLVSGRFFGPGFGGWDRQGSADRPRPLVLHLSTPLFSILRSFGNRYARSAPLTLGLPDGPPATTATITAAPNPTQQWAITLDGTVVGGEVSVR